MVGKLIKIIAISSAVLFFASCEREQLVENLSDDSAVRFAVSVSNISNAVSTKAIAADNAGELNIDMTCIELDGISTGLEGSASIATKGDLIDTTGYIKELGDYSSIVSTFQVSAWNDGTTPVHCIPSSAASSYVAVNYSGTYGWTTSSEYIWKEREASKTFYAYANLPSSGASVTNTTAALQTLSYTVPATASAQKDILMGYYQGDGSTGSPAVKDGTASIHFYHPLTAVLFKVGTIKGVTKINSISIEGVYKGGTAVMTPTTVAESLVENKFTWTPASGADSTMTVSQAISGSSLPSTGSLLGDAFLLVPQKFAATSTARMIVNCTINGDSIDLYYPLASSTWKAGHTNVYTIGYNAGVYTLSITEDDGEIDEMSLYHLAGRQPFQVTSYVSYDEGTTKIPVSWHVEYSVDEGASWSRTVPDWIGRAPSVVVPTETTTDAEFTFSSLSRILDGETLARHNHMLSRKSQAAWTTSEHNRKDLSGGGETANCYIVNTSGYFKIPLVYGNARKADGTQNTNAFDKSKHELTDFRNYQNKEITKMYIYEDITDKQCTDATLVWQDQPNLVTDVKLSKDKHFLEFNITDDWLIDGNAVVAVRDNDGKIMWSWHIWVTDFEPSASTNETINYNDKSVSFMKEDVGECPPTKVNYIYTRAFMFKIVQNGGNMSLAKTVNIVQPEITIEYGYNAPFFQHGRKDPEPPSTGLGNDDKLTFVTDSSYVYRSAPDNWDNYVTMDVAIQNPNVHYNFTINSIAHWLKPSTNYWAPDDLSSKMHAYRNLWGAYCKTIYDPSPVGYRIPSGDMYSELFTKLIDESHCVWSDTAPQGFDCSYNGQHVFMQSFGHRQWTGAALQDVNVKSGTEHWGTGLYHNEETDESSLGFSLFYGDNRQKQGWTSGNISYTIKPCVGN